jgi:SAM-dependent methyltransferase
MPAVATILLGLAIVVTAFALIVIVIGRDPSAWYRGLSLDFPYYVWRTKVVSGIGLHALDVDLPGLNPDRPGFPALASLVGSVLHMDTITLIHAVQVATTVGVGLAAGAFAICVLGEPRWSFPVFALMTGASAEVAWTSIKSLDNLLVDAVAVAIAVAAISSATGKRGRAAAIAGFAAVALIHWFFGGLFLLLLGGVTLVLLPGSVLAWRRGASPLHTPGVRMGVTVAGGALAGVASLFALSPGPPVKLPPTQGNRGNATRLPSLHLPFTGPLAAVGAVALWRPDATRRRVGLALLVLWSLSVPLAMLASEMTDRPIKVFRVAGFALGIPILGAAALVAAVRFGRRLGVAGAVAGAIVLAVGLTLNVASSVDVYRIPNADDVSASRLDQVRATNAYLDSVPPDRSLVFLVSIRNPFLIDRLVRSGLPEDRIMQTHLYVGGIEDLLAQRPGAQLASPLFARIGRAWWNRWWHQADDIMRADPLVFYLSKLNTELDPPAGAQPLAPGVLLVRGAPPPSPVPATRLGTSWTAMLGASMAVLLLLGLVGSGWTRWLLPVGGLEWLGLSPGVGVGVLALLGSALGRVGLPLGGIGGAVLLLGIAALGWVPWAVFGRSRDGPLPPKAGSVDASTAPPDGPLGGEPDFGALAQTWDLLGERDPLWAILTNPGTHGGQWSVEKFFEHGRQQVDGALGLVEDDIGWRLPTGAALDFGCGVGRLTQALCRRFDRVDGVDIAPSMIRAAEQFNRFGDRCRYHLNVRDDLALFLDGSFDFIYSTYVLQHMHPAFARRYVEEFVRLLSPGGLALFQIATAARRNDPLPTAWFAAEQELVEALPTPVHAGEPTSLHVRVANRGPGAWPSHGAKAVRVGARWRESRSVVGPEGRGNLPADLGPGDETVVEVVVPAPDRPGDYVLECGLLQEEVAWFADKGGPIIRSDVVVVAADGTEDSSPADQATEPPMQMHPTNVEEVTAWVAGAGGRIVRVIDSPPDDNYEGALLAVAGAEPVP